MVAPRRPRSGEAPRGGCVLSVSSGARSRSCLVCAYGSGGERINTRVICASSVGDRQHTQGIRRREAAPCCDTRSLPRGSRTSKLLATRSRGFAGKKKPDARGEDFLAPRWHTATCALAVLNSVEEIPYYN